MPIKPYGVLKAVVVDRKVETGNATPHYQIHLRAAGVDYRAAVNVRSQQSPPDLLYAGVDNFTHPIVPRLAALPDGFTQIDGADDGPALDYIRGNLFDRTAIRPVPTAEPGPDNDLGDFLDHYVSRALGDERARAYLFGQAFGPEPHTPDKVFHFLPGNGIHDVHMNQGNSGRFAADDGVYQDGGLLLNFPADDTWVAVFLAFQSQSWHTDDRTGHTIAGVASGIPEDDRTVRIVAASGNAVTLLNTTPAGVDLAGWSLAGKPLTGVVPAGETVRIPAPRLSGEGGTLTLLNAAGLKVDGVAYTEVRDGWTVVF